MTTSACVQEDTTRPAPDPAGTEQAAAPSPSSPPPSAAAVAADPPPDPATTTPPADTPPLPPPSPPACYLVQYAIAKAANVGTLARLATAFGADGVLVVGGSGKLATWGAHGAERHVAFTHFPRLADAVDWLRERGIDLVGVEIDDGAVPVTRPDAAFRGPTAFLLGNEGDGLSPASIAACDRLVYIPQHGPGTASLNVACAAAIVLHRFSEWAGFQERARAGGKFSVGARPPRTHRRGVAPPPAEQVAADRAARKAAAAGDWADGLEGGLGF
jgi:tRNA G18 (ribose-2'-O)-methylase SpoU